MFKAKHIAVYIAAVWLIICGASVHATGIGPAVCVEGGAMIGDDNGFASGVSLGCSLKLDRLPIYWELNTGGFFCGGFPFDDAFFDATLTGDYWITNPVITKTWKWYCGVGGAVSGGVGSDCYVAIGPRAVFGVNTFTLDGFTEVFIQCALQAQAMFSGSDISARFTIPVAAGMRLWY